MLDNRDQPANGDNERIPGEYFKSDFGASQTIEAIRLMDAGIDPDRQDSQTQSPRLHIKAFATFVSTQSHILQSIPQEIIPLARNHASGGFVVELAERWAEQLNRPWIARDPRPTAASLRPARLLTLLGGGNKVAVTADGRFAVSAGSNELHRWNLQTGQLLYSFDVEMRSISAMAMTPDGRTAIAGEGHPDRLTSNGGSIAVCDVVEGTVLATLSGHNEAIRALALSEHGEKAISASDDHTLRIWSVASGSCLLRLDSDSNAVALTGDGSVALSADVDKTVSVWDVASGDRVATLGGYESAVVDVSVTRDGRIALAADRNTLRFWDVASGRCLRGLQIPSGEIERVMLTPDGRMAMTIAGGFRLFSGERRWAVPNSLCVWDVASGDCLRTLDSGVSDVAVTPDGGIVVSSGRNLQVWDVVAARRDLSLDDQYQNEVAGIEVINSPDDTFVLSTSYNDLYITDAVSREIAGLTGHEDNISCVALSCDGRLALSGSFDGSARLWDVSSRACLRVERAGYGNRVAFFADGRFALSGSAAIDKWDLARGDRHQVLPNPRDAGDLIALGLAPDESFLVSSNTDSLLRVSMLAENEPEQGQNDWQNDEDFVDSRCLWTFKGHTGLITGIVLTPDGRAAISASTDCTLHIWDLVCGRLMNRLIGHSAPVRRVVVTPDGRTALSASEDYTIRIWDVASGSCTGIYYAGRSVISISGIRPDGRFLCIAGKDIFHLTLRSVPQGAPLLTAVRLFRFALPQAEATKRGQTGLALFSNVEQIPGDYEREITAGCPWCGKRFPIPAAVADAIGGIVKGTRLDRAESLCLKLHPDTWKETRLLSECALCHQPLRFNPFIIDDSSGA